MKSLSLLTLLLVYSLTLASCYKGPDPVEDFPEFKTFVPEYVPKKVEYDEPPLHYYLSEDAFLISKPHNVTVSSDNLEFNFEINVSGNLAGENSWTPVFTDGFFAEFKEKSKVPDDFNDLIVTKNNRNKFYSLESKGGLSGFFISPLPEVNSWSISGRLKESVVQKYIKSGFFVSIQFVSDEPLSDEITARLKYYNQPKDIFIDFK